jgi:hypothetical protein
MHAGKGCLNFEISTIGLGSGLVPVRRALVLGASTRCGFIHMPGLLLARFALASGM